jgi:hypothetical protein
MSKKTSKGTTWADIVKGDRVEIGGKEYDVEKAKPKGKLIRARLTRNGKVFEGEQRAKDAVTRLPPAPLHDEAGAQTRWAKPEESGDPWETPRDRVEEKLDRILGAVLVAETDNEAAGYFVPPQDVTTIASHLAMFHAKDADETRALMSLGIDDMLEHHASAHAAALNGAPLPVNHWHTKTRPRVAP